MGKNQCVLLRNFRLTWGSLGLGKFILVEANAGPWHGGNTGSGRELLAPHLGAFEGDLS